MLLPGTSDDQMIFNRRTWANDKEDVLVLTLDTGTTPVLVLPVLISVVVIVW